MKKITNLLAFIGILIISGCQTIQVTPDNPFISDLKLSSASGFVQEGESFEVFFTIENPTKISYTPHIIVQFEDDLLDRQPRVIQTARTELDAVSPNSARNYRITFRVTTDASQVQIPQSPISIFLMGDGTSEKPIDSKSILVKISD